MSEGFLKKRIYPFGICHCTIEGRVLFEAIKFLVKSESFFLPNNQF